MFRLQNQDLTKNLKNNNKVIYQSLYRLFEIFKSERSELYLVGGCVRDMLLNKEPKDYDLCTNVTPLEVELILADGRNYTIIETGLKHGTVTVHDLNNDLFFEITTYRIDGEYKDSRHPEEVTFTPSLEEDLKRRDFTINSFAYNLLDDELLMLDEKYIWNLKLGLIKAVGDPNKRFQEDALRMMRAIRFSSQLNFPIETETWNAIKTNASLIANISKERIRDELTKIICSNHPENLALLYQTNLSTYMLPILNDMMECSQNNKWHYLNVAQHTFEVMRCVRPTPLMRWAAFFHDCGKPSTKVLGDDGWEHFYGHPAFSATIADNIMLDLKFDNNTREAICLLVKYHDIDVKPSMSVAKCKRNLGKFISNDFNLVPEYLELRRADAFAHKVHDFGQMIAELSFATTLYEDMLTEKQPMLIKDLKINGNDLKAEGLVGKEIGDMLKELLQMVIDNPELNEHDTLIKLVKERRCLN